MKTLTIIILTALMSLPAAAQTAALEEQPGYVDFGALDSIYGEPRVMINIGGSILKLIAMASQEDPEAAEMIRGLDGVRINVYDTGGNVDPALEQVAKVKAMLEKEAWEPIVQVKENGEEVQIFMKANEERMQGLAIMAVDGEEAVFLNILGEVDPAKLGQVMKQLNVDVGLE
jgi:hypothetical protein